MSTYLKDETGKKFQEILFRAGYGVQSRELNAIQQVLQGQISSVGDFLFKDGSPVIGGGFRKIKAKSIKVQSTYVGSPIDFTPAIGETLVEIDANGDPTGAEGLIVQYVGPTATDPAVIVYQSSSLQQFGADATGTRVRSSETSLLADVMTESSPYNLCEYSVLDDGIFYFDGRFVPVNRQTHVHSKFSPTFSGSIGLVFNDAVVTEFDDESLYDHAGGHANFNAPGAHRYSITATLTSVESNSSTVETFVILEEIEGGLSQSSQTDAQLNLLGDILARRTFDESGDYVKDAFQCELLDVVKRNIAKIEPGISTNIANVTMPFAHRYEVGDPVVISGTTSHDGEYVVSTLINELQFSVDLGVSNTDIEENVGSVWRTNYFGVRISPGTAYVKGYEITLDDSHVIEIPRALTTATRQNAAISSPFNRYFVVDSVTGLPDVSSGVNTLTLRDAANLTIGTVNLVSFDRIGQTSQYRVYFTDMVLNPGSSTTDIDDVYQAVAVGAMPFNASVVTPFRVVSRNTEMLVPVEGLEVASTTPTGTERITYGTQQSQLATTVANKATFTLVGQNFYEGIRSEELIGDSFFENNYQFSDGDTGALVTPTSAIIDSGGQSIVVEAVGVTNLAMIAPVNLARTVRSKTVTTETVHIPANSFTSANRTFDLGYTDVTRILSVVDGSFVDVTSNFELIKNDTSTRYVNSSIRVLSGDAGGTFTVTIERYSHSGTGPFSASSYTDPTQPTPIFHYSDGGQIDLRNTLDFRTSLETPTSQPRHGGSVIFDYDYYLPRKDLVVLDSTGSLYTVQGLPSLNPKFPVPTAEQMVLFRIDVPARTTRPVHDVSVERQQTRRFTMADIGRLQSRISRLEQETSLGLLESRAKQSDILDSAGMSRFKTGFLVDNFSSHALGNTSSTDYRCAVDPVRNELRPMAIENALKGTIASSENIKTVGSTTEGYFLTNEYDLHTMFSNNMATKGVNVTPFLVYNRHGVLKCSPATDFWRDVNTLPTRNVSIGVPEHVQPSSTTTWGSWRTAWVSSNSSVNTDVDVSVSGRTTTTAETTSTRTTTTTGMVQSGVNVLTEYETYTESLGENLVDTNIAYFMRAIDLDLTLESMRPDTDLHVFFDGERVNDLVSVRSLAPAFTTAAVRTSSDGAASLTLAIPAGRFHTGDREILVTDEPNAVVENGTTFAKFIFSASGSVVVKQDTTLSVRVPQTTVTPTSRTETRTSTSVSTSTNVTVDVEAPPPVVSVPPVQVPVPAPPPVVTPPPAPTPPRVIPRRTGDDRNDEDPLAQTFMVSGESYPEGVFLAELDLFFRRKPGSSSAPKVIVELREVVNGYPVSASHLAMSQQLLNQSEINIPSNIEDIDEIRATPTTVKFPAPIYLESGKEYAVVVKTASNDYELFLSELGEQILGTTNKVTRQPILGSSFRSQNGRTWTAYQNDDLMMTARICRFDTSTSGRFTSTFESDETVTYSVLTYSPAMLKFRSSGLAVGFQSVDAQTLVKESATIQPHTEYQLPTQRIVQSGTRNTKLTMFMRTASEWVAPMIDLDRHFIHVADNQINNFGLRQEGLVIENTGSGYPNSPTVTITGGGGVGASAVATATSGQLTSVTITNAGSGYTSPPTITVSGGAGAVVTYNEFETAPRGGNAECKYISIPVRLAEGFSSDAADCYIDINRPSGTDVQVYFRSRSSADEGIALTDMPWRLAEVSNKPNTSDESFVEARFSIDLSYTRNTVTYPESDEIQCKIVLTSENAAVVPKVKNFRLITSL